MQKFFFVLKLKFLDAVGGGVFFCVRRLEHRLSPAALWTLVSPVAAGRTALNLLFRKPRPAARLPEFLHGWAGVPAIRGQRRADYLNRLLENFPDRLADEKWRGRCRIDGLEHWHAAQAAGRPVVLAFFHFGPIFLMGYWLRAFGLPVAAFSGGKIFCADGSQNSRTPTRLWQACLIFFIWMNCASRWFSSTKATRC